MQAFTGKAMAGAMTYLMIETVKNNAEVTYGLLLDKMHEMVEQFNNKSCLGKFLPRVLYHRKIQVGFPSYTYKMSLLIV